MLVTKTIEIDMGHRVPNHESKCKNLHGHRYKIEVGVDDKVITDIGKSNEGMVIDFSHLKEIMVEIIDKQYDHGFMMYKDDEYADYFRKIKEQNKQKIIFVNFIPTAENISKHWFNQLIEPLSNRKIKLSYVKVWETPSSTATYTAINFQQDNI